MGIKEEEMKLLWYCGDLWGLEDVKGIYVLKFFKVNVGWVLVDYYLVSRF